MCRRFDEWCRCKKKKNKPGDFDFLTFSVPVMKQTISMCFLLWMGGGVRGGWELMNHRSITNVDVFLSLSLLFRLSLSFRFGRWFIFFPVWTPLSLSVCVCVCVCVGPDDDDDEK